MNKQDYPKIYEPSDETASLQQRTAVRVLRHLENELKMVCRMESLTLQLNLLIRGKALEKLSPQEFNELETISDQINNESEKIRSGRQTLATCLQPLGDDDESPMSVRQFILRTAEPFRKQLDEVRTKILQKSHSIRAILSSSQAVVFYSVNAYRQLLEGLMDINGSAGQYRADGPSSAFPTGKLLRKTC